MLNRDGKRRFIKGHLLSQTKRVIRKCLFCNKEFKTKVRENRGKYCSRDCVDNAMKGKVAWNKGLKGIYYSLRTEFKKGHIPSNWKGKDAGYSALHQWMTRHFGKAKKCYMCDSIKNVEWANLSHKYIR